MTKIFYMRSYESYWTHLLLFLSSLNSLSQNLEQEIILKSYCNQNLSDTHAKQLRSEILALEGYLVDKGLLADKSGPSYRKVYKAIAEEGELVFDIDTSFTFLDTLDFKSYVSCFYRALEISELNELDSNHLQKLELISKKNRDELDVKVLSASIINNVTEEDLELTYFKFASLILFYRTSTNFSREELLLTDTKHFSDAISFIRVSLNQNEIYLGETVVSKEVAYDSIYRYLSVDHEHRGVELAAFRGTSYEFFIKNHKKIREVYVKLKNKNPDVKERIQIIQPN
ncbi:MAG: hypothetical protein AAF616_12115 [Bacteroidota bacterium]